MLLAADNNGGRYNRVHRQTDDGLVISVAMGNDLTPLLFCYYDFTGCKQQTLLSSSFYPHKSLMRADCGVTVQKEKNDLLFSWNMPYKVTDGFSSGPSGEYEEIWHEDRTCAKDVSLGFGGERTIYSRKDREYWTPDQTLQATAPNELFGWEQYNPNSRPRKKPNKCGIVTLEDEC